MTDQTTLEPIPQPQGYPLLGNLFDLKSADTPTESLMKLARQYGPIFQLDMIRGRLVVVSGFDLVDELCDDKRFDKLVGAGQRNARASPVTACSRPGLRSRT